MQKTKNKNYIEQKKTHFPELKYQTKMKIEEHIRDQRAPNDSSDWRYQLKKIMH